MEGGGGRGGGVEVRVSQRFRTSNVLCCVVCLAALICQLTVRGGRCVRAFVMRMHTCVFIIFSQSAIFLSPGCVRVCVCVCECVSVSLHGSRGGTERERFGLAGLKAPS